MNTTGALRKLFTELAWNAVCLENDTIKIDKNDIVDDVLEVFAAELWQDEVISLGTLEGLNDDAVVKQLIHNLVDWSEIANRVEEIEYEAEQARDDYNEACREYNRLTLPERTWL